MSVGGGASVKPAFNEYPVSCHMSEFWVEQDDGMLRLTIWKRVILEARLRARSASLDVEEGHESSADILLRGVRLGRCSASASGKRRSRVGRRSSHCSTLVLVVSGVHLHNPPTFASRSKATTLNPCSASRLRHARPEIPTARPDESERSDFVERCPASGKGIAHRGR